MCHVAFMKETPQYLDLERITEFEFLRGKTIILGAVFEPFIHPEINRLIDILNRKDCRIVFITNGRNLSKTKIPAIFDSDLAAVTFSFDGITKETYERIRVGGNFEKTLENIDHFRETFSGSDTFFAVNYTVLLSNMNEVPFAPVFWEKHHIDLIRFIPMVVRNDSSFLMENSIWPQRKLYFQLLNKAAETIDESDLRISVGSSYFETAQAKKLWGDRINDGVFQSSRFSKKQCLYHREFEYGALEGMAFPCKSPFTAARITWDGTVNVCQEIPIGNLYENKFDDIWNGPQAEEHRNQVGKSSSFCKKCDYFRFCINSHYIDLELVDNYYEKTMRQTLLRTR